VSTILAGHNNLVIDGHILLHGDYVRHGDDLVITTEFDSVTIQNYWNTTPLLTSPNGSEITPRLAQLLSINDNPTMIGFTDPKAIGEITIASGTVTVQRANQTIELKQGDFIYLNDLVSAKGGSVGITFSDNTALSIEQGARMVIDEYQFDASANTGTMSANMLGGGFSFVSGDIAKIGNDVMTVKTPVLTIGVRGTQVAGQANAEGENNEIVLLPNADGTVGQIAISNASGSVLLTKAYEATVIMSATVVPSIPVIMPKEVVNAKFAKAIATNLTTQKTSQKREAERKAEEKKKQLDEEKKEIEENKEKFDEEKKEIEEKTAEAEKKEEELKEEIKVLEEELENVEAGEKEKLIGELKEKELEIEQAIEIKNEIIQEKIVIEQEILKVEEQFKIVEQQFEVVEAELVLIAKDFKEFIVDVKNDFGAEAIQDINNIIQQELQFEMERQDANNRAGDEDPFKNEVDKNNEEFQEFEQMMEEEMAPDGFAVNPDEGQGFNEGNDVFGVDEGNQVDDQMVEQFIQEEKEKALMDNPLAQEMDNFFQEMDPDNKKFDQQVKDMIVIESQNINEWFDGAGAGINNADDFYAAEENDYWNVIDNNEDAYHDSIEADDIMDQFIHDMAEEQNINVAPWLDMPNAVTVNENLAVNETLGYVYGSDANNDQLTYSIFDDPTGKLKIVGNRITLDSAFSVTEDTTYTILLKVEDPYGASDIDSWQIVVENNHSPEISNTSAVSLGEDDGIGTAVSTISASDAESETITYAITAGNTGNAFTINSSTGAISTAAALDYEATASYTLTITATDTSGNATTTTQTVNVAEGEGSAVASSWVTAGDGSAGAYKMKIAHGGSTNDGVGVITELGHTAEAYDANNLSTYDVIAYYNYSNSNFAGFQFSTAVTSWVNDGGVLVMYDRYVNDAGLDTVLPGHDGNVVTTRLTYGNEAAAYQIVDEGASNLLKYGPGGIMVDDTSDFNSDFYGDHAGNNWLGEFNIGGGSSTNHGYMTNLDSDVLGLATTSNTGHYTDAVWAHGDGAVYYSTVPLDAFTDHTFTENDAWDAYALNSLHYATSLVFDGYSVLNGTSSADRMYGTTGDDTFAPGTGSDEIWTGNGSDTIKYTALNQSDLDGENDVILDFDKDYDMIDISAITNGASISRILVNNTLFKIDTNNDNTYDMQWDLDDFNGSASDITVLV